LHQCGGEETSEAIDGTPSDNYSEPEGQSERGSVLAQTPSNPKKNATDSYICDAIDSNFPPETPEKISARENNKLQLQPIDPYG